MTKANIQKQAVTISRLETGQKRTEEQIKALKLKLNDITDAQTKITNAIKISGANADPRLFTVLERQSKVINDLVEQISNLHKQLPKEPIK